MLSCRICKATGDFPVWCARDMRHASDEIFVYFRCDKCRCLQIEEVPKDLYRYYEEEYYSYKKVSKRKLNDSIVKGALRRAGATLGTSTGKYAKVAKSLFRFPNHHEWFARAGVTKESMILDVGCGAGVLLARLRKEGFYNASGIDPFIKDDIIYDNGLEIKKGRLERVAGEALFDLLMMHHSLEHIPDQASVFAALSRLITPGGTVLLRVPISTSLAFEKYKTDWVQLDAPRHLYLHSEQSLALLAKEAGLEVTGVEYDSWEFQFYGSELLQRGILIDNQKDFLDKNGKEAFGKKQMESWKKESEKLNTEKRGDMAIFYLKQAEDEKGKADGAA